MTEQNYSREHGERETENPYIRFDEKTLLPKWALRKDLCGMLQQQEHPDQERLFNEYIHATLQVTSARYDDIVKAALDADPPFGNSIFKYVRDHGGEDFIKQRIAQILNKPVNEIWPRATNGAANGGDEFHAKAPKKKIDIDFSDYQMAFQDGPSTPHDELTKLYIESGNTVEIADKTIDLLVAQNKPIYQRGGKLVQPIYTDRPVDDGRILRTTRLVQLDVDKLRYFVGKRSVLYYKWGKMPGSREPAWILTDPPDKMLKTILAPEHWAFHQVRGSLIPRRCGAMARSSTSKATTKSPNFMPIGMIP